MCGYMPEEDENRNSECDSRDTVGMSEYRSASVGYGADCKIFQPLRVGQLPRYLFSDTMFSLPCKCNLES